MTKEKQLILEEIKRFNQINGYIPGEIKNNLAESLNYDINEQIDDEDLMGDEDELEGGTDYVTPIASAAGGAYAYKKYKDFKNAKTLTNLSKTASAAKIPTTAAVTTVKPTAGWGTGLPKWAKAGSFAKLGGVGIAAAVAAETSADPGVTAVGNIIAMGATGAAIGSFGGPYGMAIGALIGGGAGAVMSQWSEENAELPGGQEAWVLAMNNETWEAFDTIKKKESLDKLEIISSSEATVLADKLYTAMHGGGTNENRITDAIDAAPSLVDVSRVHDKFGIHKGMWPSNFSGDLTEWLEDELSSSELNRLKNQLRNKPVLIYDGKEINTINDWEEILQGDAKPTDDDKRAENFKELWKNYPCVVSTASGEGVETNWSVDDKQVTIKIGDAVTRFSHTGKFRYKGPASGGEVTPVGTFTCSGDEMAFEDNEDMAIAESSGKLSNILKETKKIIRESDVEFGGMTLQLPDLEGKEKETETTTTTEIVYTLAPSLASVVAGNAVIKKGHRGDSVRAIQSVTGAPIDGKYGPTTEKAVRTYQNGNGLGVNGIVNQETATLITNAGTKSAPPKKIFDAATTQDEENVNLVAYEMEQTTTDVVNDQIEQLSIAIAKQPTKQTCIQLIGTAAAGCKMGVKNINKNSLSQCYNSYNFGLNRVGMSGKSRKVKKCYDLQGRGNEAQV